MPATQFEPQTGGLFVRTRGNARASSKRFDGAAARDARRVVRHGHAVQRIVGVADASWQLGATMFVAFGALALVLAAIGCTA